VRNCEVILTNLKQWETCTNKNETQNVSHNFSLLFCSSAILTIYIQHFKENRCNLGSFQNYFLKISVEGWFMAQDHHLYLKHVWFETRSRYQCSILTRRFVLTSLWSSSNVLIVSSIISCSLKMYSSLSFRTL
jgi:hypothetical protein